MDLTVPGSPDDYVVDSHQNRVKISVLTQEEAKDLAAMLRTKNSTMGKINSETDYKLCEARAYQIDCNAEELCGVTTGRIYLPKSYFAFFKGQKMTVRGRDYDVSEFHTANLVYILDGNGDPQLHVIDHYANRKDDGDNGDGAFTPVPYVQWATQKIQARNWEARFVPRFSLYKQLEHTDVKAKCFEEVARSLFRKAGEDNRAQRWGTVR